jgi:hypothetical protein
MRYAFAASFTILMLAVMPSAGVAQIKNCEELKAEIAAKIDANGVKDYTLEIVPAESVKDEQVVGSCEGGTKRITYKRN